MNVLLKPKVSVVIPSYNSAPFIKRTLASVLAQTFRDFEIIVSDDGSTDDTVNVVENFLKNNSSVPWKILKNPYKGPGAARNAGIMASSGEWIAFLDSDDLWFPHKLEKVMKYAKRNKRAQLITHSELCLFPDGSTKVFLYYKMYKKGLDPFLNFWRKNLLATSAVVLKKDIFKLSGYFDETLYNNQDYDLWLRVVQHTIPHYLPDIFFFKFC